MGNQQSSQKQQSRWSFSGTEIDAQHPDIEAGCCGIGSTPKKSAKQKQTWKINLEDNCDELGINQYPWVKSVIKAANAEQDITRNNYLKEIQQIQFRFEGLVNDAPSEQNLQDEHLFQALEKSILITQEVLNSFGPVAAISSNKSNPIKKTLVGSYIGAAMETTATSATIPKRLKKMESISFIDESMSSLFKNRQIQLDDKSKQDIKLFIRLTELLERHTRDPANNLTLIKDEFITFFTSAYSQSQSKIVTQQLLAFIDLYKLAITDYYKLDKVAQFFHNEQVFDDDNLTNLITSLIFKDERVYQTVYNSFVLKNKQNQTLFNKYVESFGKSDPSDFHIADEYCLNQKTIDWYMEKLSLQQCIQNVEIQGQNYNPYEICVAKIKQLDEAKTPMAKLKVMISCAEKVSACMKEFYQSNSLEVKKSIVDADQILSIFEYIIVNSKVSELYTHLDIIQNFANKSEMKSMAGYYYSVIHSALEHITSEYKKFE